MERTDRHASWPSALNLVSGLLLVSMAVLVHGRQLERLDSVLVGVGLAAIGIYHLYRWRVGLAKHPDLLRIAVFLGLWVMAVSLDIDWGASSPITVASVVVGVLVVGVNAVGFIRRFKNRPRARRLARRQGIDRPVLDASERLRSALRTTVSAGRERLLGVAHRGVNAATTDVRAFDDEVLDLIDNRSNPTYYLPLFLALPVGVGAGIGAAIFRFLMVAIHSALFGTLLSRFPSHRWIAVLPVLGAGVAGFLIYHFAPEAAGHGVPENMEAIAVDEGRIRHRLPPFKVLVSALTLGAGGSGGREGPIARIGAGIGSSLSQLAHLSARNTRLLLAAGIAGGIGATFGAPIGGVLFGVEIVMVNRIKVYNVLVLAVTSIVAVATVEVIAPNFSWFTFLPFPLPQLSVTPTDVLYTLPFGVLMGLVAWAWVVLLDRTERVFNGIDIPDHVKPAIGALPVGILGIFYARYGVMGVGYVGLRLAVTQVKVGALLLIALAVAKLVATQFTIGSGGSGGVFAPTLYIGGLLAVGVHHVLGVLPVGAALVGVVGMGAIFAGAAFAPLTAMFLVAEVFNNYALVAILAVPCLVSFAISRQLLGASIYTARLNRKGILSGYAEEARQIGPDVGGESRDGSQRTPHPGRGVVNSTD